MLDAGEAHDKIIAVSENDPIWAEVADIAGLPAALVARLWYYSESYKLEPGQEGSIPRVRRTAGARGPDD